MEFLFVINIIQKMQFVLREFFSLVFSSYTCHAMHICPLALLFDGEQSLFFAQNHAYYEHIYLYTYIMYTYVILYIYFQSLMSSVAHTLLFIHSDFVLNKIHECVSFGSMAYEIYTTIKSVVKEKWLMVLSSLTRMNIYTYIIYYYTIRVHVYKCIRSRFMSFMSKSILYKYVYIFFIPTKYYYYISHS